MARVIYTEPAIRNLRKIKQYILKRDKDAAKAASALVDEIKEKCRLYAIHPSMGRSGEEFGVGVRWFPYGNYVIFYKQQDNGIAILHVYHGARDLSATFGLE